MGKPLYSYNVIDVTKDECVLKAGTLDEVSETTGCAKANISYYVTKGYLYNRKYLIHKNLIEEDEYADDDEFEVDEDPIDKTRPQAPPGFEEEWERVCILWKGILGRGRRKIN
jgi:hypothetical protein